MAKKSLVTEYPDLVSEWHPTKNENLSPSEFSPGSRQTIWWRCRKDISHEWKARISQRVKHSQCPFCSGWRVTLETSLAAQYPEIALEWHPTKNKDLKPEDHKPRANKKVWWRCKKDADHEWQAPIRQRVNGSGCPFCVGMKVTPETSLATLFPEIALEWHSQKNFPVTPEQISPGSSKKYWWECKKDSSHEWETRVSDRTRGSGCPICAKSLPRSDRLLPFGEMYPELLEEWHKEKNRNLHPRNFTVGSRKKVWWKCKKDPRHAWQASIYNRTRKGNRCPLCSGLIVDSTNSLKTLFPDVAEEWHPTKNSGLKPIDVRPGSGRKVWWICKENPDHVWQAIIYQRAIKKTGCPFCKKLGPLKENSLQNHFPQIASEWHPERNGDLTPDKVASRSGKKVWWQCKNNSSHEWQAQIKNRTYLESGCPFCYRENAGRDLSDKLLESVNLNTEYYNTFLENLDSINSLSSIKVTNRKLNQIFNRMLYANVITAMETYLSDAFINTVTSEDELIRRLMETTPDFSEKKYRLSDIYSWLEDTKKSVTKYLLDIVYHNIWKVSNMYKSVLEIDFPNDLEEVQYAIINRHDIVHRNGKTKDGETIKISKEEIDKVIKVIKNFIAYIEIQLNQRNKHSNELS